MKPCLVAAAEVVAAAAAEVARRAVEAWEVVDLAAVAGVVSPRRDIHKLEGDQPVEREQRGRAAADRKAI